MALIGKDISHSKSKEMYEKLLGETVDYHLLDYKSESEIPGLEDLLLKYPRISITAPYKSFVYRRCSQVLSNDLKLESVNAIKLIEDKIVGINTDLKAFSHIFNRDFISRDHIIILGDGNMSLMIQAFLCSRDIEFLVLSRRKDNLDKLETLIDENTLVINCCSREYVCSAKLPSGTYFWDMNYSFSSHQKNFSQAQITYRDGLELLELQANFALSFWN
jgi:shikimate dehydrogenase